MKWQRGGPEKGGDVSIEVFAAFYRDYYRVILTVAQQRLRGSSEAEDVTAEVFRLVWQHCANGDDPSLPWAYGTLRNLIGNEYRRSSRADQFRREAERILMREIEDPAGDDALEVRRALRRLSDSDREIIYMAYWENLEGQEIAEILACTVAAVRVRLHRARRRLKAELRSMEELKSVDLKKLDVTDG